MVIVKRLLILAALTLTACTPTYTTPTYTSPPTSTAPPTSAMPPAYSTPMPNPMPPTDTMGAGAAMPAGLRAVHSPGTVTDDMHLQAGACHAHGTTAAPLPDPACTPGAYDPAVTQATIKTTICMSGWTATVRPPAANTSKWKRTTETAYGDPAGFTGEYDHLVPLELGGANSTSNLWPEPGAIPNAKDRGPEHHLHDAVCAGKMTLAKAQAEIATDWTTAAW